MLVLDREAAIAAVAARRGADLSVRDGQRRRSTRSTSASSARSPRSCATCAPRTTSSRPGTSGASSCGRSISRSAPPMLALMDLDAVRDAAFCHRHREITREQGKALARERLERARREGAEWVVLFEDVTPLGSHRLEMHVAQRARAARLVRAAARRAPAEVHARGRPARPGRRRVAARQAAGRCRRRPSTPARNGRRASSRRASCSEGADVATHPKKIIDAHCHIGEIPPWKFYDLEHPVKPTVYDYPDTEGVPQAPHGLLQGRAGARDVQLRRADPRAVVRPQRRRDGRGDHERPHPRGDLGVVPAAQRRADPQGAQARVARRAWSR